MVLPNLVEVKFLQQQYHHEQHDLNFDNLGQKAEEKIRFN
jgi:hypothetical protein